MRPTLLVVDDVKECADGLVEQLECALGQHFSVDLAESPAEAIEILDELEQEGGSLALVLSDLIMPQLDGARLLVELHRRQPRALKLLYSGCPRADDLLYLLAHGRVDGFFVKPWSETLVAELVQRCLAQLAWPLPPNLSLLEGSLPPSHATASEREAQRLLHHLVSPDGVEALLVWLMHGEAVRLSPVSRFRSSLAQTGPGYYRAAGAGAIEEEQSLEYLQTPGGAWRILLPLESQGKILGWYMAENPVSKRCFDLSEVAQLESSAAHLARLAVATRLLLLPWPNPEAP